MSARATPRNAARVRVAITLGVVVGVALSLATFASAGSGVWTHTICVTGALEANQVFWTPWDLTNAPYLGRTIWGASFDNWGLFGPGHVVLSNGNLTNGNVSTGYFETQNWSVYEQSNRTELGPGVNGPCVSPYVVMLAHTLFDQGTDGVPLQGPGNTSNVNEPTSFYGFGNVSSHLPTATFANGFVVPNMPPVSTCGEPARSLNFSSTSFDVSITIQTSHGPVPVVFSISSLENYTYYFPANGGTWQVDDLQENTGLRGPGLAFSWTAC